MSSIPVPLTSMLGGTSIDVAVDGGAIRVETLGIGPPVVFLHGWTLDRRVWGPQLRALANRFQLILPDRRGFGQASAPADIAREPDDIARMADALNLPRFALVGMSQGARVALAIASRHPARVGALAVQGAPLSDVIPHDEHSPTDAMTALVGAGRHSEMRDLWRAHPLMHVADTAARQLLDRIVADYDGRDLLTPQPALEVTQADCRNIRAPVLAITGAHETPWRHRVAAALHSATGALRVDIAGGGHLCNLDRPDAYNAALGGFLDACHDRDVAAAGYAHSAP